MRIAPISFMSLKMVQNRGIKVPADFSCKDRNNETYTVAYEHDRNHKFTLKDNDNIDHSETFDYFDVNSSGVNCVHISTQNNLRQKGLSTIFHLTEIIEMFENNLDVIKLESLPTAVIFHAKCGFKSNIKDYQEARLAMRSIIPACFVNEKFYDCSKKAANTLVTKYDNKVEYIKNASKIFDEFLNICADTKGIDTKKIRFHNDPFDENFTYSMKLTREDVLENKEFYNNLYKKYGIDYQID